MSYSGRGYNTGSQDPWAASTPPSDRYVREPRTGRYVRTPPARLPELSSQNGHDTTRSSEDLRGLHYDRIPPVRNAFEDSVRRDEEPSLSHPSVHAGYSQAPLYPVSLAPQVPGAMYYPAPFMVPHGYGVPSAYFPPTQPHMYGHVLPSPHHQSPRHQSPHHQSQHHEPKRVRYDDRPTYYSHDPSIMSQDTPTNGSYSRTLPNSSPHLSHINSRPLRPSPETPARRQYLIASKNKPTKVLAKDHPLYIPSFDAAIDLLEELLPPLVRELVVETSKEMVSSYLSDDSDDGDMAMVVSEILMAEVTREEVQQVVKGSVQDLATDHLEKASAYDVASFVMDEYIEDTLPAIMEEAKKEVMVDLALDTEVIDPLLNQLCQQVAMETLEYYHDKVQHREHKEVMRQSQKRVLDSVILDYLLSSIAATATPPGESEEEAARQLTEQAMLTILLEQVLWIPSEKDSTVNNKPLAHHHEKAFMEVALDVLTEELCATLDEDLADYDDYEQGLWNPNRERPPEWALYTV